MAGLSNNPIPVANVLVTKDLTVIRKLVSEAARTTSTDIGRLIEGKEDSYLFNSTGESPLLKFEHSFNAGDSGSETKSTFILEFVDPKDDLIRLFMPNEAKVDLSELMIREKKAINKGVTSFNAHDYGVMSEKDAQAGGNPVAILGQGILNTGVHAVKGLLQDLKTGSTGQLDPGPTPLWEVLSQAVTQANTLINKTVLSEDDYAAMMSKFFISDYFNELRKQTVPIARVFEETDTSTALKRLYITYGLGTDSSQWVGPYLCTVQLAEYDYSAEGAKIIKLTLLPDLVKNMHTKEDRATIGRVALDWKGFGIFAEGRASFIPDRTKFMDGKPDEPLESSKVQDLDLHVQDAAESAVKQYLAQITMCKVPDNIVVVLPDISLPKEWVIGASGGYLYPRSGALNIAKEKSRSQYLDKYTNWLKELGFGVVANSHGIERKTAGARTEQSIESDSDIGIEISVTNRYEQDEREDDFAHVQHREWSKRLIKISRSISTILKDTKKLAHTPNYVLFAENDAGLISIWKKYGLVASAEDTVLFYGDPYVIMPLYYMSRGKNIRSLARDFNWLPDKTRRRFGDLDKSYIRDLIRYLYPSERQMDWGINLLPSEDEFAETANADLKEVRKYIDKKKSTGVVTPVFKSGTTNPNILTLTIAQKDFIWRYLNILPYKMNNPPELSSPGGSRDIPEDQLLFSAETLTNLFERFNKLYHWASEDDIREHLTSIIGPYTEGWEDPYDPPGTLKSLGQRIWNNMPIVGGGQGNAPKLATATIGTAAFPEVVVSAVPINHIKGSQFKGGAAEAVISHLVSLYSLYKIAEADTPGGGKEYLGEYNSLRMPVNDSPAADLLSWYQSLRKETIKIKIDTLPMYWIGHQYVAGFEASEPAYLFLREMPVMFHEAPVPSNLHDISRKLFTGMYTIIGFKHVITGDDAHSEFHLVRGMNTLTEKDLPQ